MKTLKVFFVTLLIALICPFFSLNVSAQTYTFEYMPNPDPNQNVLFGLWGTGNTVYAVGNNGTFLKFDGSNWTQINCSSSMHLAGVSGSAANDVWAVGTGGAVVHYNGTTLSTVNIGVSQDLASVISFATNDVYVCGDYGTFYHYNGSVWNAVPNSYAGVHFYRMSGTAGSDLYVVGKDAASPYTARLFHYDGSIFTEMVNINYDCYLPQAWTPDENIFYLDGGPLQKFNNTSGTVEQLFDGQNVVCGFSTNCIVSARHIDQGVDSIMIYNGSTWKALGGLFYVMSLCSPTNNPNNIYMVGEQGGIFRINIATGIEETTLNPTRFDVYPNPATDLVTIDLNFDQKTDTKIELFDVVGQRLELISDFGGNEDQITFNVGELPHGLYLIKVTDREGRVVSKKLTK